MRSKHDDKKSPKIIKLRWLQVAWAKNLLAMFSLGTRLEKVVACRVNFTSVMVVLFLVGSLGNVIWKREDFPFTSFSMYAFPFIAEEFTKYFLVAELESGEKLDVFKIVGFKPLSFRAFRLLIFSSDQEKKRAYVNYIKNRIEAELSQLSKNTMKVRSITVEMKYWEKYLPGENQPANFVMEFDKYDQFE